MADSFAIRGNPHTSWADAQKCEGSVCPRTNKAVGWQSENSTFHGRTHVPSADCSASAAKLCGSTQDNYLDCVRCISNHSLVLEPIDRYCSPGLLELDFCPSPPEPLPNSSCAAKAAEVCGFSKALPGHECRLCLSKNRTMMNRCAFYSDRSIASMYINPNDCG